MRIISGCLNSLCEQGLAKEVEKGKFRRVDFQKPKVVIKPVKPPLPIQQESDVIAETPKTTTRTALDILAEVEIQADKVMNECSNLKNLVAKAALEIEEHEQSSRDKTAQLEQFKKLLKSIAD